MPTIDKSDDKAKINMSKKRLGRGLGSLLSTQVEDFEEKPAQKAFPQSNSNQQKKVEPSQKAEPVPQKLSKTNDLDAIGRVWSLAIEKIIPNQTQPRKDFLKEPLMELSESIKAQGVIQPITVRKKGESYEIIAGERRWRASQMAGLKEVPAIIKDVDDQKSMELALIENLQREDLNPVEEAMGYQLLIDDYDLSQQDLAQKVGKSRSTITNSLRVLTLPRDVRQMLRQGFISVGHAKVLLSVEEPTDQVNLAKKVIKKKLSVRVLEKEIRKLKRPNTSEIKDLDMNEKLAMGLAEDLQKALGTKVKIQYKDGKGHLQIAFYSDDELTGITDKIKNSGKK